MNGAHSINSGHAIEEGFNVIQAKVESFTINNTTAPRIEKQVLPAIIDVPMFSRPQFSECVAVTMCKAASALVFSFQVTTHFGFSSLTDEIGGPAGLAFRIFGNRIAVAAAKTSPFSS
jgi:hypothetical protein